MNEILDYLNAHPFETALLCGFFVGILSRIREIKVLFFLKNNQRTKKEKQSLKRGLRGEIISDFLIFIPVSITLFWLLFYPYIDFFLISYLNPYPIFQPLPAGAFGGVIAYGLLSIIKSGKKGKIPIIVCSIMSLIDRVFSVFL